MSRHVDYDVVGIGVHVIVAHSVHCHVESVVSIHISAEEEEIDEPSEAEEAKSQEINHARNDFSDIKTMDTGLSEI